MTDNLRLLFHFLLLVNGSKEHKLSKLFVCLQQKSAAHKNGFEVLVCVALGEAEGCRLKARTQKSRAKNFKEFFHVSFQFTGGTPYTYPIYWIVSFVFPI